MRDSRGVAEYRGWDPSSEPASLGLKHHTKSLCGPREHWLLFLCLFSHLKDEVTLLCCLQACTSQNSLRGRLGCLVMWGAAARRGLPHSVALPG